MCMNIWEMLVIVGVMLVVIIVYLFVCDLIDELLGLWVL